MEKFVNGACGGNCVDMAFNGVATGAGNARACSVIRDGHCHSPGQSGLIDDQSAIDNICHTVSGGNLKYMMAERPIFAGRFGYTFLDSQTVTTFINTNANLYTHTSDGCAKTKIVAIETSYGQGGPGDITGGYRVRLASLAWRWPTPVQHDPMSSYHYVLALKGGEMTSVPYKGVPGGSIRLSTCTNGRYCSGSNSLAAQTTAFRGSGEVLCGPCGLVLLLNN